MQNLGNTVVVDHPVVRHELTILRDKQTTPDQYRAALWRLMPLLAFEAAGHLTLNTIGIETPMQKTTGVRLAEEVVLAPILRAGDLMVPPMLTMFPKARICYLGIKRDEKTARPERYYTKMPANIGKDAIFLLDQMVATGGSACDAISQITDAGGRWITFVCVIASAPGLAKLAAEYPSVRVVTAAVDEHLDDQKYILPGLGDAGDRSCATL